MNTLSPFEETSDRDLHRAMETIGSYYDEWAMREAFWHLECVESCDNYTATHENGQTFTLPYLNSITEWVDEQTIFGYTPWVMKGLHDYTRANNIARTHMANYLKEAHECQYETVQLEEDELAPLYPEVGQRPDGTLCTSIPKVGEWVHVEKRPAAKLLHMLEATYKP